MKILLAVTDRNDPRTIAACISSRYGEGNYELDILTVLPASADPAPVQADAFATPGAQSPLHQQASALLNAFAAELESHAGKARIRTHVEYGDAADVILACSRRWRSSVVMIEAPRRKGLLTAFRLDGVTRRLLAQAGCPVQMLRPQAGTEAAGTKVLVPVGVDQLASFPFSQLQALPWTEGSSLHLLGVVPPPFDESLIEASPAAVVKGLHESRLYRLRAEEQLARAAAELEQALGQAVHVQHEVVEGSTREVTGEHAGRSQASLIVMASAADDGSIRGIGSTLSPAAIAMSAACSVLLLRSADPAAARAEVQPGGHYAQLSSR